MFRCILQFIITQLSLEYTMRCFLVLICVMGINFSASEKEKKSEVGSLVIGQGQMPNATTDDEGNIHVVFGSGDSIMYSLSNNHGNSFSKPALVSILPKLVAFAMRGPQIAATSNSLTIIACNKSGDIFSYKKAKAKNWQSAGKVNDVDTVSKEGLMGLAADGQTCYAVWLDLRDQHNKIFGAKLTDSGKSWSKNKMIYSSPDKTVCECCKPSVAIKGNDVFVMFRNWLNGNRDLYLIKSIDGGTNFAQAQKLGNGSWALNGCPMDGGGLAVSNDGSVQTVWRRESKIFWSVPGKQETQLGEGKSCTIESTNGKNVYAWTEKGKVIVMKPNGTKESLGSGILPIVKAVNNDYVICVWENEKQIYSSLIKL